MKFIKRAIILGKNNKNDNWLVYSCILQFKKKKNWGYNIAIVLYFRQNWLKFYNPYISGITQLF